MPRFVPTKKWANDAEKFIVRVVENYPLDPVQLTLKQKKNGEFSVRIDQQYQGGNSTIRLPYDYFRASAQKFEAVVSGSLAKVSISSHGIPVRFSSKRLSLEKLYVLYTGSSYAPLGEIHFSQDGGKELIRVCKWTRQMIKPSVRLLEFSPSEW